MSNKGYIKLYRDIQDHWMWTAEKFSRGQAWIDLLMMANHKDAKVPVGEHLEIVKRGQFITSISKLADRWKWSFNTTKKFLNLLESDNMLIRKSDNSKTLITIVNYGLYQSRDKNVDEQLDRPIDEPIDEQGNEQGANLLTELLITNKNDKNVKNVKNVKNEKEISENLLQDSLYSSSFEHVWKLYPRHDEKKRAFGCYVARLKAGWTEEELERATKAYAEECKKENREKKYIKQAKTFFGVNEPFSDYIPKQQNFSKNEEIAKKVFLDEVAQWIPPYHGFPEEWFDGDKLVEERVTPLIKPREPKLGWYSEEEVSKKELIEDYYIRKKYVSEHKEEADEFKRKASEADQ